MMCYNLTFLNVCYVSIPTGTGTLGMGQRGMSLGREPMEEMYLWHSLSATDWGLSVCFSIFLRASDANETIYSEAAAG